MKVGIHRGRKAVVFVALLFGALWGGYFWLYHGWAASGPPSPNPEWHYARSVRYGMLMLACLAALVAWMLYLLLTRARRTV